VDVLFLQNMITIKLKGGLGNQMFQYATGLAVAIHNNDTLALDISHYKNQSPKDTPRFFELPTFNISASKFADITPSKTTLLITKIKNKLFPNNPYTFDPKVFSSNNLEGAFQNETYFIDIRDQILKEFTLKKESEKFIETKKYIKSIPSVSIHVRRGDYVSNPHAHMYHGVQSSEYYKKAYDQIVETVGLNFTLFIFTDDVEWAQKNITFHTNTYIISTHGFSPTEELLLMSYCSHNIIANSSFSWWGAWLNQNPQKIVIAPQQWTAKNIQSDIIPKSWKKI
jgi:hypothetical protein